MEDRYLFIVVNNKIDIIIPNNGGITHTLHRSYMLTLEEVKRELPILGIDITKVLEFEEELLNFPTP